MASTVNGIPEELGPTGLLLPDPTTDAKQTVAALASAIQVWAIDADLRRRIGNECRSRALSLFRAERMIDETLEVVERALLPERDYVSPGLAIVRPDPCFPHMQQGDPGSQTWPFLRRNIPHNWYVDGRWPNIGWLNRDEASILYNSALQFKGRRALEIGCFVGWSACHLALAGVELDVIDPLLAEPKMFDSVHLSLDSAGVFHAVHLYPGCSPQAVVALSKGGNRTWSLIFIDGDHDGLAPLHDAEVCAPFADRDAMVLFHDLASPDVAQGLDYLRGQGWRTMIYHTMQIMGVAWRGSVQPVQHQPDPSVQWHLPQHLAGFEVSLHGWV